MPGKKKGKKQNTRDDEWKDNDTHPSLLAAEVSAEDLLILPQVEYGKKSRKKLLSDNWEDELEDKDEEMDMLGDDESSKLQEKNLDSGGKVDDQAVGIATAVVDANPVAGGKKGKKKKKKDVIDWDDDITAELEELSLGDQPSTLGAGTVTSEASMDTVLSKPVGGEEEEGKEIDQVVLNEGGLRTAAQKRAEKKEREKEKKRKEKEITKSKEKAKTATKQEKAVAEESKQEPQDDGDDDTPATNEVDKSLTVETDKPSTEEATAEGVGDSMAAAEEDEKDDKKKKKKKKKTEKEEKSVVPKTKKPGSVAIKKMKENLELLRLEQKRREEEELDRLKAEQEAEDRRLEQLRLEQERKEKKRQKEKERKERLRREGKLLTKADKEKKLKNETQIKIFIELGVVVPGSVGGGEKKPVRYGTRDRNKQKKPSSEPAAAKEEDSIAQEDVAGAMVTEDTPVGQDDIQGEVLDNWDDDGKGDGKGDNDKHIIDDDQASKQQEDITNSTTSISSEEVAASKDDTATVVTSAGVEGEMDDKLEEERASDEGDDDEGDDDEGETSSSEEEESDDEDDEDRSLTVAERMREKVVRRIVRRREARQANCSVDAIRSPIVCVLGHVDTGKTKILDKIRHTNVQDGEAGGITQQIGATFVPESAIREQTTYLKEFSKTEIKLPGLLIIDTPGHECFSNLRTRGSSMCDIAILVVDLMHGLEPQTIESLNILKKKKIPFIVALNKIDRLFEWRRCPTSGMKEGLKKQKPNTRDEFEERTKNVITEFAEQSVNVALFWEKVNFKEYVPVVPTSAISGDGMGDLIALLVTYSQKFLINSLMFSEHLDCIVLEVKAISGLGTTIDVILRNGILREGDTIVLCGSEGPLVTQIRALLMPQPLRELRVKNSYVGHKLIPAAQGVKVTGKDFEKALAGFPAFVAEQPDEVDILKEEVASLMKDTLSAIHTQERGVYVQASTLGSLEALLGYLKDSKIPYCGVNIGPVHRKDVMKCSVMLEHDSQWAVILAFDVRVERDAQEMADGLGVKIFTADIIYHLFDNFMKHRQELKDTLRDKFKHIAVFPCKLRILPDCVFNARDPIVVGVVVEGGIVKPGTPIVVPSKNALELGVISTIEINHKLVEIAHKGQEIAVKIESVSGEAPKLYGRHFDHTDVLVSKISRDSIDAVKNYFREDLQKSDWQLMIDLKKILHIY